MFYIRITDINNSTNFICESISFSKKKTYYYSYAGFVDVTNTISGAQLYSSIYEFIVSWKILDVFDNKFKKSDIIKFECVDSKTLQITEFVIENNYNFGTSYKLPKIEFEILQKIENALLFNKKGNVFTKTNRRSIVRIILYKNWLGFSSQFEPSRWGLRNGGKKYNEYDYQKLYVQIMKIDAIHKVFLSDIDELTYVEFLKIE